MVAGAGYEHFNWMQTVATSDPTPGHTADKPYADHKPGEKFYLNAKQQEQAEADVKPYGASTGFSDRPQRNFSKTTIKWHANLNLVGIKKDGNFDKLRTLSYGFTIDAKGVHLEELKGAY